MSLPIKWACDYLTYYRTDLTASSFQSIIKILNIIIAARNLNESLLITTTSLLNYNYLQQCYVCLMKFYSVLLFVHFAISTCAILHILTVMFSRFFFTFFCAHNLFFTHSSYQLIWNETFWPVSQLLRFWTLMELIEFLLTKEIKRWISFPQLPKPLISS